MKEDFIELIKLLELKEIRFIDSHETVLDSINPKDESNISINTEQLIPIDDPQYTENKMICRPKYSFTFSLNENKYFKCEYILMVVFNCKDIKKVQELFQSNETKDFFFGHQMNRTLWTILRSTVMNAFNRHSLQPVVLPWIK